MDEFTFPTVPDGQCKLAPFPPPWFVVAEEEDDGGSSGGGGVPWGRDEKMDMLWEDFNEELARAPPVCPLSPLSKGGGLMTMAMMKEAEWFYSDGDGDEGGVIETRKRSGRHMVVRRRRWSLLLMLRLLKKLFLVKKSRNGRTAPI
ncbi:hypothetical protein D1007_00789 [Hordeum vulgare]|uniref:Predicted protein n=1 Tax=Hordeum vulgare subsp. vulgare TaxID=112509 RepID=F2E8B7_HORVV|nr:uncharacterized protein LOC123451218 [Hordeum vulgare subsp. vulgare]KAE8821163.1 hypothetical protein D1007_00789 [Hordeum vulgare]KAI4997603.1 hypothetical protein ZWY2020_052945 [Hordeum vulgare]BAK03589.1 predicted protein [Hordeum vulgare subsp. vulgare]